MPRVVMLSVIMLSVIMQSVIILNVVMLSVIILIVINKDFMLMIECCYSECHLCRELFMLSVLNEH